MAYQIYRGILAAVMFVCCFVSAAIFLIEIAEKFGIPQILIALPLFAFVHFFDKFMEWGLKNETNA